MPAAVRYGSIKRFGARYGRRVKHKLGKIEEARKLSTQCPYCHKTSVKRLAMGIWFCGKCKSKFTGKAYTIGEKIVTTKHLMETEEEVKQEAA